MRTRTMAESAAVVLHELIMSGELPAGTHLRLTDLASRLGMSVMPVREGLRRLEVLGLVEIEPHRGAKVRDVSIEDLEDTYLTRMALESLAVRMAASRFTDDDRARAERALVEQAARHRVGDPIGARQAHADFHFALYRASGSHWLLRAIEPVWENSERYRFGRSPDAARLARVATEHQRILAACLTGDGDAAAEALRSHLAQALHRIRDRVAARAAAAPRTPAALPPVGGIGHSRAVAGT